jgi:hypothetical protein
MVLFGANQDVDQIGYRTGCTDGKSGVSGLRVLFFGTQEAGGKIRPPGTTLASTAPRVDEAAVERASLGWIRGFTQCGSASAVVAVSTNNKSDGGVDGAEAGTRWAKLVERIGAATPAGRVTVGGGLDGEPSWSAPDWARGWVGGFVQSSARGLYVAGSADGCLVGNGQNCAHGWTVQDVYYMATGAGTSVYAVPQIYRTDGIQARQWAGISRSVQMSGRPPVRFAGAMTQQTACKQKPPCDNTDNAPGDARDQLSKALADPDVLDGSGNVNGSQDPDGSKNLVGSNGPGGSTSPGTLLADSKSTGSNTFGSTDVAWPDDQSALAWVTTQPSVPGAPTG